MKIRRWLQRWHQPSPAQREILQAMLQGWTLKSHRYLDGTKCYQLHSLHGDVVAVAAPDVEWLAKRRWIQSNQKFPAATFLLTERGRALCNGGRTQPRVPLGAQCFLSSE